MKKRFSSYLLMGKVATLPAVATKVMASNPPDYNDLTSAKLSIVTLPAPGQVALKATTYGNAPTVCVQHGVPSTMSVVVTGVNPGDNVFLAASLNAADPSMTQWSPNLQIGSKDLTIIDAFQNIQGTIRAEALSGTSVSAVKLNVDLAKLASAGIQFNDQSQFYLQALIVPQSAAALTGSAYWNALRYSPLVTVTADAAKTQYSSCYGY